MISAKKMNEQLVNNILKSFKDGTYDALMYGIRSETNKNHFYYISIIISIPMVLIQRTRSQLIKRY